MPANGSGLPDVVDGPTPPKRMFGEMKLWCGSWNMGAVDPFQALGDLSVKADEVARILAPFVPKGLDVYVFAVQEGVSDKIYEAIEQYTGCFRLPLHTRLYSARDASKEGAGGARMARSRRVGQAIRTQDFINEARMKLAPEPLGNTSDMVSATLCVCAVFHAALLKKRLHFLTLLNSPPTHSPPHASPPPPPLASPSAGSRVGAR